MIVENFPGITITSIQTLLDQQIPESLTLEYKQELPTRDSSGNMSF